jgi:DNA-binding XRE family transcriptional regulator
MIESTAALLFEARRVLGLSQAELGARVRASRRTMQRHESGRSSPVVAAMLEIGPSLEAVVAALGRAAGTKRAPRTSK